MRNGTAQSRAVPYFCELSTELIPAFPDQEGAFVVFPSYICQKESIAF